MAIAFRSYSGQKTASATSAVITKPADTADGDALIVVLNFGGADPGAVAPPDASWTLAASSVATTIVYIYTKIASSEGASWTFTWANSLVIAGWCAAYSGVANPALDTDSAIAVSTTKNSELSVTGVDPVGAADILVGIWLTHITSGATVNSGVNSTPGGMTARVNNEQVIGAANKYRMALFDEQLASGAATGNRASTWSSETLAAAAQHAGYLITLKPAVVGGGARVQAYIF